MATRRRGLSAALVGLMAVVVLGLGWQPASGNDFEGNVEGPMLNVVPSDDLPPSQLVTVTGIRFFPDISVPAPVTVHQCYPQLGACGPPTDITPLADGTFSGTLTVVRMLQLSDMMVDCAVQACEVSASGNGSAAHHLTFSTIVPTTSTTTRPPAPTTTVPRATTTTTKPPVTTTSTPTTVPPPPTTVAVRRTTTTTVRPTTTSSTSSTSTTSTTAPRPTTTTVPPPPAGRPPLLAVTPRNESSGPPGGGLHVEGVGYTCDTVYFFFDGVRIGAGSPDAAGAVSETGLSVPGAVATGRHTVASSCEASGRVVEQAAFFQVLPASIHRPAIVTALPLPDQVSLDPGQLLISAAVAVGAIALIAFPYELFNSTMEENYDEIRAWFGLGRREVSETQHRRRALTFVAMTAVSAAACGFLSPDFGLNETSLVLFVGMFVAMVVMAVVFSLPADFGIHRQYGEWGKLNFLPGSVIVSILFVVASRLLNFQPGYFYGALAGLAFRSALTERDEGKMAAANWLFSLVVSVGAFFLRAPVAAAAARPGASIWWIGLEACLVMIFLWGVEGLAVAMLPMRFLDGRKVMRWSRTAWSLLFFLGVFATVHVLLRPGSGYVGKTSGTVTIGVMALYAAFGVGSAAFWAYFRYRPQRLVSATTLDV